MKINGNEILFLNWHVININLYYLTKTSKKYDQNRHDEIAPWKNGNVFYRLCSDNLRYFCSQDES